MAPLAVLAVVYMEDCPLVTPMVLPAAVPMFTLPAVTLIPHQIPLVVDAPLDVYKAKPAMVLLSIWETTPPAVKLQLRAIYLVALVVPVAVNELGNVPVGATELPMMLVVPVPVELANPITFPVIVYPDPI